MMKRLKTLKKEENFKMDKFDFSGWATKANLKCSDGRIIRQDAFKDNDGQKVPLVWNHKHDDTTQVLGHALLENRDGGVYAYCKFNNTESGKTAKELVKHGDVDKLSIYANQLKQQGPNVIHGNIREVSLVLAGANPGALIEDVMMHSADGDYIAEDECIIHTGEYFSLVDEENEEIEHSGCGGSDEKKKKKELEHSKEEENMADMENKTSNGGEKTVADVFNTLNEEQKDVVYFMIGQALEDAGVDDEDDEGGNGNMKHNVFDQDEMYRDDVLTHSDQESILTMAKQPNVGSLQHAMDLFAEENSLQHGIDDIELLFPEYKDVKPGAPELLERDQTWVGVVMNKAHKSPISRIRTRQADARAAELRAKGYKKGNQKTLSANIKLLSRTTDPQTVYRKDELHRDDILDITDFDVVSYQYGIMRRNLEEDIAMAIVIGDGREDVDPDKISEDHIRSIWHDDELYTIHADVDIEAAKAELQGTDTNKHFGDNYIYAEAIITAALYARERYKGSGSLDFFCTPHLLNVMLLARDLNGRRIYDSKSDLAAALNVNAIYTVEQFEGKTRTTDGDQTKKLLGLFVNMADYQIGSTKGGEITKFNQFDIDFNKEKYLLETRLSGALTKVYSAIALEEPVTPGA